MKFFSMYKYSLLSLIFISSTSFALDNNYKEDITYGLSLSFNCPVFTISNNHLLKQQLNLNYLNKYD